LVTHGVPFCIGASDGCLASLGSGALEKGHAAITIGTSGALRIASGGPLVDEENMFFNYLLDDNLFICGGPVNNGGNVAEWLATNFTNHPEKDMHIISESFSACPAGADGLVCLPYFHGERAPVWNEEASGVFFGIKMKHQQHHFIRAAIEGVCFAFRQLLDDLEKLSQPVSVIHASGGFIKSNEWVQMLSDITGKKIIVEQHDDASAVGAAIMGMKATGMIHQYDSFPNHASSEFLPDKSVAETYERNYKIFLKLYPNFLQTLL
jgi:gluconokinase